MVEICLLVKSAPKVYTLTPSVLEVFAPPQDAGSGQWPRFMVLWARGSFASVSCSLQGNSSWYMSKTTSLKRTNIHIQRNLAPVKQESFQCSHAVEVGAISPFSKPLILQIAAWNLLPTHQSQIWDKDKDSTESKHQSQIRDRDSTVQCHSTYASDQHMNPSEPCYFLMSPIHTSARGSWSWDSRFGVIIVKV